MRKQARDRALDLAPTIKELQAAGWKSLRAIAAGLEERGFLRRVAANGLLFRFRACWRRPAALSTQAAQAQPPYETQALKTARAGYPGALAGLLRQACEVVSIVRRTVNQ